MNDLVGEQAVAKAAQRLWDAETSGPCSPVRELIGIEDLDAAYAVQELSTERSIAHGRRIVGRKIGLTSPAVQKQLGVDQPDFGMLYADMAVGEGMPIAAARTMQPKIEAEIALILGADIQQDYPTIADVALATAYVAPALEIVGSRIADWDIRITDTIADNASSGLFVLGGPLRPLADLDLGRGAVMTLKRGGEVVSEGSGEACLGHPLNAAVWLAGEMARRGRPLRAGEIVLTGALGAMVPVSPGDVFSAEIAGLGQVSAHFAEETGA